MSLAPAFGRKTPFERSAFLGVSLPEETDVAAACRWLLGQPADEAKPPGLGARLGKALTTGHGDDSGERIVDALFALVPEVDVPGLLLVQPGSGAGPDGLDRRGRGAPGPAGRGRARLTLLVAIEPEALERFHAHAPSRVPKR